MQEAQSLAKSSRSWLSSIEGVSGSSPEAGDQKGCQECLGVNAPSAAAALTAQVRAWEPGPGLWCQCRRPRKLAAT